MTMKRKSIIIILAIAIIASATIALVACDGEKGFDAYNVTVAQAKEIAILHSGLPADDVQNASVVPEERKDGTFYQVEFTVEGVKYTYRINTANGDIEKVAINDKAIDKNDVPVPPSNPASNYIGADRAKEIAFEDVGCAEQDVLGLESKFDFDDGKYLYEIEFTYGGKEYDYEIVAESGEIYKVEVDNVTTKLPVTSDETVFITVERAKEIALADSGIDSAAAVFEKVKLDTEYGQYVYEVEFVAGTVEYKYEINAVSGTIIKKETETDKSATAPADNIGAENATAIAIAHSAVPESAIYDKEAKLEVKKGVYVYEVEFKADGYEYEYVINAKTGDIISVEKEIDD